MIYVVIAIALLALVLWVSRETPEQRSVRLAEQARKRAIEVRLRAEADRKAAISCARQEAERLRDVGAIFGVTNQSSINGYHLRPLGWIKVECEERSGAERELSILAARKFESANVLVKLTSGLREERYQAGTGPKGNPYYRNRKKKYWEALACEASLLTDVDKPKPSWRKDVVVVDGSNVAHFGSTGGADDLLDLAPLKSVLATLSLEGVEPRVVFDANIGYKLAGRHLNPHEIADLLGNGVDFEIVASGTIADRRIIEKAGELNAPILSNDLFRDSLRARHIPKRKFFYVCGHSEVLPPRP